MKIGSLFSGIGGLELGLEWAGVGRTSWQVENNPFCLRVLERHWPDANRTIQDARRAGVATLDPVDVLCGGFPCQDVSSAGRGAGIKEGTRSGLWIEFARIIGELRPRFVVVENVASGKRRWLPQVRRDLHMLGYDSSAFAISAADVGAPHLRRRIFVIAHPYGPELREQSGRSERADGESPSLSLYDGQKEPLADSDRVPVPHDTHRADLGGPREQEPVGDPNGQRELQQGGGEPEIRRRPCDSGWWATEPDVGRVAYGVPASVDRLAGLGNAVVPYCAEVAGRILLDIAG